MYGIDLIQCAASLYNKTFDYQVNSIARITVSICGCNYNTGKFIAGVIQQIPIYGWNGTSAYASCGDLIFPEANKKFDRFVYVPFDIGTL